MLSKKTLELLIDMTLRKIYEHSVVPHDPLLEKFKTAYKELIGELNKQEELHKTCNIIVEVETTDMNDPR